MLRKSEWSNVVCAVIAPVRKPLPNTRIEQLARDPRPSGAEMLSGQERYRVRQGDYRMLYEIHDHELVVVVVRIGHRREVYRA